MGLKVYGMPMSTNTIRVLSVLNEKGVEFELVPVDLRTGAHKQPNFLALNPFGQIPVLEDGEVVLFESRAINRYIANKYKDTATDLLPATDLPLIDLWLEIEAHQFNPSISSIVFEALIKPLLGGATNTELVETQAEKLSTVLDVYEKRLSESKYLAGNAFTLADLNHIAYLNYFLKTSKAGLVTSRPHIFAWWQDISARPGWQKTVAGIPLK